MKIQLMKENPMSTVKVCISYTDVSHVFYLESFLDTGGCCTITSIPEETFERWKRIEAEYQKMQDEMATFEKTWKK
jgi:hypothetical protein